MPKRIITCVLCLLLLFADGNVVQASEMDTQKLMKETEAVTEESTEEFETTEKDVEEGTEELGTTEKDVEESTEELGTTEKDVEESTEEFETTENIEREIKEECTETEEKTQENEKESVGEENVSEEILVDSNEMYSLVRATDTDLGLSYSAHLSDVGWTSYESDNSWCGNTGNSNTKQRIEAIKIKLNNTTGISGGIKYDVLRTSGFWSGDTFSSIGGAEKGGWTEWVSNNTQSGSTGTGQHIEAVRIRLTGKLADYYYVSYYVKTTVSPSTASTVIAPKSFQWTALGVNDESFLDKDPSWNPGEYSSSYDFAGTYNYTLPIEAFRTTIKNRKISYTVNPNGGVWNSSSEKKTGTMNANSTKTFSVPTRKGYTFAGWSVSHSESGVEKKNGYQPVSNDIPGSFNEETNIYTSGNMNVTLKANWEKNYTLTIDSNGGSYKGDTTCTLVYGASDYNNIGSPTRKGYSFDGWFDKGGTKVYDNSGVALKGTYWSKSGTSGHYQYSGNLTVYAHWSPHTYTVSYIGNGNTGGSTASSKHTYDKAQALTTNGFTKTGYSFSGWNTKADGSGTAYANKASVKNLTSSNDVTIKLHAQWSAKSYTLTYNGNGGTTPAAKTALYDSKWGTLSTSTRIGYVFVGWYDAASGGVRITSDTLCIGNKTVYAHWMPITYSIFYNGNGSTDGATGASSHIYDTVSKLTANGFARAGYTFAGWNTKADGSGTDYNDKASISNLTTVDGQTITLYAQWRLNPVTVSVPRSLILNQDGDGSFVIKADNETGTVTVNADNTINLTQKGKDRVLAGTVSFDRNTLTPDRHEIKGSINTESLSAGSWKGVLNLNITFKL